MNVLDIHDQLRSCPPESMIVNGAMLVEVVMRNWQLEKGEVVR